jgi:hypothetical protein
MSLSHIEFNEQVTSFASDVSNAISALKNGDRVQVDAELASADIRLRAVVNAKVDLCTRSEPAECLAELRVDYKLCVDSSTYPLRPPDQHRRPHRQHGRAWRVVHPGAEL